MVTCSRLQPAKPILDRGTHPRRLKAPEKKMYTLDIWVYGLYLLRVAELPTTETELSDMAPAA